ncbi:sensor histidine kinase [Desertihabitans aurantiacus]|uniref:sensor histidine kinase n=1 Tax=Desertihabitans aurantiacus TaxID=2282477 RepID=UPI0013007407|nr:sensor histidine kinase [Desertihabitans aurantiacus]
MVRAHPRVLLLDVPLALLVGLTTWVSLFLAKMPVGGPYGAPWEGGGPPWREPSAPPFAAVDVPPLLGVAVLVLVVAVALRRLRPLAAFLGVVLAAAVLLAWDAPFWPLCFAPALSLLALASTFPPRRYLPWTALLAPVLALGWWSAPEQDTDADRVLAQNATMTTFALVVFAVALLLGTLRRARWLAAQRIRADELRQSADAERLRIAREVHDVVGHSLSVITMQAGVALHVVDRRPDQVEESLRAIRRTGLEAMAELRAAMGVFRDGEVGTAPLAGLDRIPVVVEELRAAGRQVGLEVPDNLGEVSPTIAHAAYRIVQESLTNVGKHAGGAPAEVRLSRDGSTLVVTVADAGPALAHPPEPGHGIAGMSERARGVGGSLDVRAVPEGGVRVTARLPLQGEAGRGSGGGR